MTGRRGIAVIAAIVLLVCSVNISCSRLIRNDVPSRDDISEIDGYVAEAMALASEYRLSKDEVRKRYDNVETDENGNLRVSMSDSKQIATFNFSDNAINYVSVTDESESGFELQYSMDGDIKDLTYFKDGYPYRFFLHFYRGGAKQYFVEVKSVPGEGVYLVGRGIEWEENGDIKNYIFYDTPKLITINK